MQAWLIDAYRTKNSVALWLRTDHDFVMEFPCSAFFYIEDCPSSRTATRFMKRTFLKQRTYSGELKPVLRIDAPLDGFEQYVLRLEELTRFRVPFYDADIPPEQRFLYEKKLVPLTAVEIEGDMIFPSDSEAQLSFSQLELQLFPANVKSFNTPIKAIRAGEKLFTGDEKELLLSFSKYFEALDPDIIIMQRAFMCLAYIEHRMRLHDVSCSFHRWHASPLKYKGGRSYWSYGLVRYQDHSVRLHGRFLLDTATAVGSSADIDAIVELCRLSGGRFQQVASRSYGAVFQQSLVRLLVLDGVLVPYKEKPIEPPLSMLEFLASDRAGHTYDPLIGFHTEVAEVDFASMYPHLIYNHNISADTILCATGPFEEVPGTHIKVSLSHKGYTPRAIKPLLDRRMWYKRNPSAVNKKRAAGLKWVLVSCYGYLRFREFKLGLPSAHMAICAYARATLLSAASLAESRGFLIAHGIIDALYLHKKGLDAAEVRLLCRDIELACGIPLSFEGVFKWIVFLPSVNDSLRPVPTRYYGVFVTGEIKVRGIELRQRSSPPLVKRFQKECLERMSGCSTSEEIKALFPNLCALLRSYVSRLDAVRPDELVCTVRLSKTKYKVDSPQKRIVASLLKQEVDLHAGMTIRFIHSLRGAVLPEEYNGDVDGYEYRKKLLRALYVLMQPFGFSNDDIEENIGEERQERQNT